MIHKITVYDGKYTFIMEDDGSTRALRHGQEWRDLTGDGFVLALAQEIEFLRSVNKRLEDEKRVLEDRLDLFTTKNHNPSGAW